MIKGTELITANCLSLDQYVDGYYGSSSEYSKESLGGSLLKNIISETLITVVTPLYTATISNRAGGTLSSYTLTQLSSDNYKHKGGYNEYGIYNENSANNEKDSSNHINYSKGYKNS